MLLNFHVSATKAADILVNISEYPYPTILLDENKRLMGKNNLATGLFKQLRKGRSAKSIFRNEEDLILDGIKPFQMAEISVFGKDNEYFATAVRGIDFWLITVNASRSAVSQSVSRIYGRASGYDSDLTTSYPVSFNKSKRHKMLKILLRLIEEHSAVRSLPFFNADAVLSAFFAHAKSVMGEKSFVINHSPKGNHIVCGSQRDFATVTAYICACCIDIPNRGDIAVNISEHVNETALNISVDCRNAESLKGFDIRQYKAFEEMDETAYWLHLLKLICDGNLWDLSIEQNNNSLLFRVNMPSAKESETYVLRDIAHSYIRELTELLFSV